MSPAAGPSSPPELFGASLLASLSSGLLTFPRAESSAELMNCSPVATLYTVNTRLGDTRLPVVVPAPATETDANITPTTATRTTALRPGWLTAAPRREITAERRARTGLSLRLRIDRSLPQPPG